MALLITNLAFEQLAELEKRIAPRWERIGYILGISERTTQTIKEDNHYLARDCASDVLDFAKGMMRDELCTVLRNRTVTLDSTAEWLEGLQDICWQVTDQRVAPNLREWLSQHKICEKEKVDNLISALRDAEVKHIATTRHKINVRTF